jgi:RNA recognition motif-containing protein
MSTDVSTNDQQPEQQPKRVYVGNLPFKTTGDQIKELFADYTVVSVSIPKARKTSATGKSFLRKLGFAFVELSTPEEAQSAVDKLNDTTLDDRQLAIKMATGTPRKSRSKAAKNAAAGTSDEGENSAATSSKENAEPSEESGDKSKEKTKPKKKKQVKKPKRTVSTKDLPDSTDTVFVTGLPRNIKKPELQEFFKDIEISEIKIATSPPRRVRTSEGVTKLPPKTFAFLKVADQSVQSKAIELYNEKTIREDTVINVQVAKEEPPVEQENEKENTNGSSEAAPDTADSS